MFEPGSFDGPDHTCPPGARPHRGCEGCDHAVARFGELFPIALQSSVQETLDDDGNDMFEKVFFELYALGVLPPVWRHCAVIATQLADGPVTIDRDGTWGNILQSGVQLDLPHALDLVDRLLAAAGTGEDDQLVATLRALTDLDGSLLVGVHLTLCGVAHHHLFKHLSAWQIAAHGALMQDVWFAISRPAETLMAARIAGAIAARDQIQYFQLLHRAHRHELTGGVVFSWIYGIVARMTNPDEVAVLRMVDGGFHSLLNLHADPNITDDVAEQGFMLAAASVRAVAHKDVQAGWKINGWLAEDARRAKAMVLACASWYSQLLEQLYGDTINNTTPDDVSS